jgi:hypothetical protein
MALYLDKLRIQFLPPDDSVPRGPSFNAMFHAEMRVNVRDVAVIIENANASTSPQTSLTDAMARNTPVSSSYRPGGTHDSQQRVNCKAISVSWDIRTKAQVRDDAHLLPAMRGWKYTRADDISEATVGWDFSSDDHAIGEIGLLDQQRWRVVKSGVCTQRFQQSVLRRTTVR